MDEVAANQHFMGIALASAAKHKLVGLLAPRLKGEGIYVGEVTTYGTIRVRRQTTIARSTQLSLLKNSGDSTDRVANRVLPLGSL